MGYRPSRMEVNLENVAFNYRSIKNHVGPSVQVMSVIKADAYGHGVLEVARCLSKEGCQRFAVATSDEAFHLRDSGIGESILIMGPTSYGAAGEIVRQGLAVSITDMNMAKALSQAAVKEGSRGVIHLKVDTGMGRIGFLPDELPSVLDEITALPGLHLEGLFTHFATADEGRLDYTETQYDRYLRALSILEDRGVRVPLRHVCNSAGTLNSPGKHLDCCRPGVILYGMWPSSDCIRPIELRPTFEVKTSIAALRSLPPGSGVGYGLRYMTRGEERIAVLPIGYADGLSRAFSMKINVLVKGRMVPQVGNICMDQTMINVTGLDVSVGDEVVIVGKQGDQIITPDDLAGARQNTINYEIPIMFSKRVPRIYVDKSNFQ